MLTIYNKSRKNGKKESNIKDITIVLFKVTGIKIKFREK